MLKDMKTHKHLKPGQMGTKRLVAQYGDALLCVRYRYDAKRGVRLKTVEIIVEEQAAGPVSAFGMMILGRPRRGQPLTRDTSENQN